MNLSFRTEVPEDVSELELVFEIEKAKLIKAEKKMEADHFERE